MRRYVVDKKEGSGDPLLIFVFEKLEADLVAVRNGDVFFGKIDLFGIVRGYPRPEGEPVDVFS